MRTPFRSNARFVGPLTGLILALAAALALPIDARAQSSAPYAPVHFEPESLEVPRYGIFQLDIHVKNPPIGNPFRDRGVVGVFTHSETGQSLTIEGYCDSQDGSLFGLRFCPQHEGEYTYTVTYDDINRSESFEGVFASIPSTIPGFLRVDEDKPHHFKFEGSGEYFFHHGYNIFQLLNKVVGDENWQHAIDTLFEVGVNKIRFLLLGGRSCTVYHYLLFPFVGTDPRTDAQYDRYDIETWRHYDRVIRYMADREMIASCVFEIEKEDIPDLFGGVDVPTENEYEYYRYAIARLGAFWNVTWDLGNEHTEYHTINWGWHMGTFMKNTDPYDHLVSAHSYFTYRYPDAWWSDYAILQAYAGGGAVEQPEMPDWDFLYYTCYWAQYVEYPTPVINDEYGFVGPWDIETLRKAHWVTVMSGAYASAGSFEALSVKVCRECVGCSGCPPEGCEPDHEFVVDSEVLPTQLSHVRSFFDELEFWNLEPEPFFVQNSGGSVFCRAKLPGEFLVYLPDGGEVTLDIPDGETLDLSVEWMDPATGEWFEGDPTSTNGATQLTVTSPLADDALLYVGRVSKDASFEDDFDAGVSGHWAQERGDWEYQDGKYVVTGVESGAAASTLITHRYDDFELEFTVANYAGSEWAGIHFRKEHPYDALVDSGYLLTIYRSGWVNLSQAQDGILKPIAGGQFTEYEVGLPNRFAIRAYGDFIDVDLNGVTIIRVKAKISYPGGYVSLGTSGSPVVFDDFSVRPLFYADFADFEVDPIVPRLGDWNVDRSRRLVQTDLQDRPRASVASEAVEDFLLGFRMEIDTDAFSGGGGVYFGSHQNPAYLGPLTGYLVFYLPARDTIALYRLVNGVPVVTRTASAATTPGGTGLLRDGTNSFELQVSGNTVTLKNRGRMLLEYTDGSSPQIIGHVALMTSQAKVAFDDIVFLEK